MPSADSEPSDEELLERMRSMTMREAKALVRRKAKELEAHIDRSGASTATRDCSECGAEKGMPHGKFCAYNEVECLGPEGDCNESHVPPCPLAHG